MIDFMRGVAKNSGGTVGETLLLTCLPRSVVPLKEPGWSVPLTSEGSKAGARGNAFAWMLNEGSSDPAMYLPAMIYPKLQIMGLTIAPSDPAPAPPAEARTE